MAEMSPMCSIMVASAIGVIVMMALRSNFAIMIGGSATNDCLLMPVKSILPISSATA